MMTKLEKLKKQREALDQVIAKEQQRDIESRLRNCMIQMATNENLSPLQVFGQLLRSPGRPSPPMDRFVEELETVIKTHLSTE